MKQFVCIVCPNGCMLTADEKDGAVAVSGNTCKRGEKFAIAELTNPTRSLTSTVRTIYPAASVLPVRTDGEIPKSMIGQAMKEISGVIVDRPYAAGEVIIGNFLGTNINLIATSSLLKNV